MSVLSESEIHRLLRILGPSFNNVPRLASIEKPWYGEFKDSIDRSIVIGNSNYLQMILVESCTLVAHGLQTSSLTIIRSFFEKFGRVLEVIVKHDTIFLTITRFKKIKKQLTKTLHL